MDSSIAVDRITWKPSVSNPLRDQDRLRHVRDTVIECNFLLGLSIDEPQMLDGICRLLVESGAFCKAWISLSFEIPADDLIRPLSQRSAQLVTREYSYESANSARVQSGTALPLCDSRSTFGALMLYSTDAQAFNDSQTTPLAELAENLAAYVIKRAR
jgi:hypothetical protein